MSVPSVGKEEPNFTKHSTIRHERSFCQKERSCLIVLCFVKFGSSLPTEGTFMSYSTVLCEVWFLFTYRRNAHVLLYCVLCVPSVGKEEPNFTKHSTIRHEHSFCM
jgi:hypothetical protein